MRLLAGTLLVAVLLVGCGDDADDASDTTTSTEVTTTTGAPVTTGDTTDTTEVGAGSCPDDAPIPGGATDVQVATVDYDGDGDGTPDTLSVFRHDGAWWIQAEWSSGGSGAVTIDEAGDMGARPLGGYDVDGDGFDEAFVAIAGPASGSIIGVYRTNGCGVWPVLDADSGQPFTFPVTASIGTFSGATCNGLADIDLFSGELVDADEGEYLVGQAPYTLVGGEVTAEPGDAGSVGLDGVDAYSTLDCGDLGGAL